MRKKSCRNGGNMSKIICDVCGTSYQESATQCPICGCARPLDEVHNVVSNDQKIVKPENYTYVKGGRFSKANVQKRLNGAAPVEIASNTKVGRQANSKLNKGDTGLVIAVCALLLAIIAVVIYIAVHFFAASDSNNNVDQPIQQTTTQAIETEAPTEAMKLCTGIVLSQTEVTLTSLGETVTLDVILTPDDTTDTLRFESADDLVATVTDNGTIEAVAVGEAVITVSCGEITAQCRVICNWVDAPTEPVTEPIGDVVTYLAPYKINKQDVSISVGETFQLKLTDANGEIVPVVWSPAVADICSVDGNSVTGQIKGRVEISTTYNGETYTCIVRVR